MRPLIRTAAILAAVIASIAPTFAQTPVEPTPIFGQRFEAIDAELTAFKTELIDVEQSLADVSAAIARFRESIGAATPSDPPEPNVAASTADDSEEAEAAGDVSVDRERIAEALAEAYEESDQPRFKKRRVAKILTSDRPRFRRAKDQMIDQATDALLSAGMIVATESGVEAAVDWERIGEFLITYVVPFMEAIVRIFAGFALTTPEPIPVAFATGPPLTLAA